MSPQTRYLYYTTTFTPAQPEDGELFDTGTILTAKSSGGALGKFSVQTRGVAPVEADLPCKLPLAAGQSLSVKWKAGVPDDDVRFVMQSGNHGEQFSRIECDSKDTGEIAVDGKLIDAYLKEWRPLESWRLLRHATGYSDTPGGRVEFVATGTIGCMYTLQ
jgi:hypothetical protein